ncbi:MAG: hypothetical protein B6I31_01665 [Desulfobacteraceae bacterium 4572_19]|nr:MAG: hypothetical protein B6I31_01665 [Desulfobacteraceae bacterium 4572_19]
MTNSVDLLPVLIIDDEKDLRDGCERILSRMDCKIFKATNGKEGLDLLKKTPISLVLLDLKMPGMDGLEVLQHIRRYDKNILVIIITGYATIETAIKAMKQGAYDFISKPFTPAQLRITVERAIEKLQLTKEAQELKLARQKTLTDLGTAKNRMRTIIETLPNGVLVTDTNGHIVLINPSAQKHLNLTDGQQIGECIEKHILDDGLREFITNLSKETFNKEDLTPSYEFVGAKKKDILAHGRPVLSDDGEYIGAVVNLMDISPMKVLDRLKSEFVAKVSHELRSPLATIHEQLNFVLKEKPVGGDKSGQHMDKTLTDIVDFLSVRADAKNQSLIMHKPKETIPTVTTDPVAIESIFGNLITNAIIYTQEEGEIEIKIKNSGTDIKITVSDNGYGIGEKYLNKIFEKFYRVKNSNTRYITGTGLGLPIVKNLKHLIFA